MNRSIPMAVKMFEPPADRYKVGCVFVAWLSGHQDHFRMVSGREGMRSLRHLSDLFVLTDQLGLFPDPGSGRAPDAAAAGAGRYRVIAMALFVLPEIRLVVTENRGN